MNIGEIQNLLPRKPENNLETVFCALKVLKCQDFYRFQKATQNVRKRTKLSANEISAVEFADIFELIFWHFAIRDNFLCSKWKSNQRIFIDMLGRFCVARMIFFEIDDFQNHFVTKIILLIFWFTRDENIKPTNDPIGFRVTGQSLKLTFQLYGDKKRPKRIQNGTCWCWSMWYNCRIGIHRLEFDRWIEIPPDISWTIIELSERIGR